jgi:hypothetical protein
VKISDLDLETKRVIVLAHILVERMTGENFHRLERAIQDYDKKYASKRAANLLRFLRSEPKGPLKPNGHPQACDCQECFIRYDLGSCGL